MKKIISYSILIFLISFASSLRSETILLKSGEKLDGTIVGQDKETVTFKLADGTTKVYKKFQIKKISFAKITEPVASKKEETQKIEEDNKKKKEKEEAELAEKQKADTEKRKLDEDKLKAKEEKAKKREQELAGSKRHYLEASFGAGNGNEQTELRPFYQTIQYAGLLFSSSGQAEVITNPFKSSNHSSTTRIKYAWNRFTFELRGTEAKGNIDINGFQTLSYGSGGGSGGSSGDRAANLLMGDAHTKFQKVSSRVGFTPYPHPVLDLQVVGGVERIWTRTSEEVDSVGGITSTGINPNRISFREYTSTFRGGSFGIGFEFKFLERFSLQGQILRISGTSPSSSKEYQYRVDNTSGTAMMNPTGLDYWWVSKGTEVNLRLSAKVYNGFSLFAEASNMTLKNTLQTGYISDNDPNVEQLGLKIFGPRILIPMLLDSKTILTYFQVGANYRFDF